MRKDAKIGFAIGGVLLAVLIVYVLVVPKHNAVSPKGVALVIPPPGSGESGEQSAGPSVMTSGQTTATDQAAASKLQTPVKSDGVDWGKLLSGAVDVTPQVTTTPGVNGIKDAGATSASVASNTTPDAAEVPATPVNLSASAVVSSPAPVAHVEPSVQPVKGNRTYVIKSGQTLSSISAEVYGNQRFYVAILRANPDINPNNLRVGTRITLPDISDVKPDAATAGYKESASTTAGRGNTYKVQAGDNLYRISQRLFGTPAEADVIYNMNKESIGPDKSRLRLGMVLKLPSAPTHASR